MRVVLYELLTACLQGLPPKKLQSLGKALGTVLWYALPDRKKLTIRAIKKHLPQRAVQARQLARQSFIHTGQSFMELLLNHHLGPKELARLINIEQEDIFFSMVHTPRPIVAVSGHFGAWELFAPVLANFFTHRPAQIIIREPKDQAFNQILKHFRGHANIQLIHRDQAASHVLGCLRQGGISSFLADQNCGRSKALFLKFLQQQAAVNMGPAMLALRAKALVWPVFLKRNQGQRYTLLSSPPMDTACLTGSREEKLVKITAFYNSQVEKMVLAYPEQWLWMHKRWKTRPKWELEQKNCGQPNEKGTS